MQLITDADVASSITMREAIDAMQAAFLQFGQGAGAVLSRNRAAVDFNGSNVMISAMGAALPAGDVVGTKVYATVKGQFNFVIVLFSSLTGAALATIEANELTRLRTAAATAVAMQSLARKEAAVLAVFGAGTQAQAHVEALTLCHPFSKILLCARSGAEEFASSVRAKLGIQTLVVDAATAAAEGDVIVTCTRSSTPLFDGALVRPGSFVAAVGSSKPAARELDDAFLLRADHIVVEWKVAALAEAGEFVNHASLNIGTKLRELGSVLAQGDQFVRAADDIILYKSVGIGLEDIALAKLVWERTQQKVGKIAA